MKKSIFVCGILFCFLCSFKLCLAYQEYEHKEYPQEIWAERLVYSDDESGGKKKDLYHLYYSNQDRILYIIMHGSKDGKNFTGIMPEQAVQELCVRNINILGARPLDKVVIVCCYPRYHKDTEVEELLIPVEFVSNYKGELLAEMYDDHFIWYKD